MDDKRGQFTQQNSVDQQNASSTDQFSSQQPQPVSSLQQDESNTKPAQVSQAQPQTDPSQAYIENTGGSIIELLGEIGNDDKLLVQVAEEMKMDKERCKTLLAAILEKISKGQLTDEELSFILTAPVVEEDLIS
ncbi:MAG TPA: hypothetical protein VGT05_03220 [Patescibacteria group bacterium]|nr:hypothetical protein [Patescibacteria group bacterium]